jgi:hypothetical protein
MWHPLSAKVGNHFDDKRRSLGRYSSLTDSDHGVFFFVFITIKTQLNSMGLSVPHKENITSPLQAQQVNSVYISQSQSYITTDSHSVSKSWCRAQIGTLFVTMVYKYTYHNSGQYPSSSLLFKTRLF